MKAVHARMEIRVYRVRADGSRVPGPDVKVVVTGDHVPTPLTSQWPPCTCSACTVPRADRESP